MVIMPINYYGKQTKNNKMDKKTKLYLGIGLLGVGAYLYTTSSKNMVGVTGRRPKPKWYQAINPYYWLFTPIQVTVPAQQEDSSSQEPQTQSSGNPFE